MAAWLTFTRDYNWVPKEYGNACAIYFRAGETYHLVRAAAMAALKEEAARNATRKEIDDARRRRAQ
jgi:hypothetical protein